MGGSTGQRLSLRQLSVVYLGAVTLVFVVTMSASIMARISAGHVASDLGGRLLPIRDKSSDLIRAYVNQETGQRGFLLTGNPVTLEPYDFGTAEADRLVPELRAELARAPHGDELLNLFEDEVAAADIWKHQAAEPQIAAQRGGTIPQGQIRQMVFHGKNLFDKLRERSSALNTRIDSLIAEQLQHLSSVQRTTSIVQYLAAVVFVAIIVGVMVVLNRMFTRPVTRLVRDVRAVADGVYDQPIGHAGPREIGEVSVAVKDMRDRLEQQARIDTVTGLANRTEAMARFEAALALARFPRAHLGVLFCDVDHFKNVNDTCGHAVGDAVLSVLAARIRECVRREDTVGRVGGDEILVLLPGIRNLDEVVAVAEKIRCRAAEPIAKFGTTVHTTLSIGATMSLPGESATTVTARADVAMYRAKQAGRNVVIRVDGTEDL